MSQATWHIAFNKTCYITFITHVHVLTFMSGGGGNSGGATKNDAVFVATKALF